MSVILLKVEVLVMEGYTKKQSLDFYECANFNSGSETFLF